MKEESVDLELAKSLKEKGFSYDSEYYYLPIYATDSYIKTFKPPSHVLLYKKKLMADYSTVEEEYKRGILKSTYPAPTLSLIQKWLREVHNIYFHILSVNVNHGTVAYTYAIGNIHDFKFSHWETYENAQEQAIIECLKTIKNDIQPGNSTTT